MKKLEWTIPVLIDLGSARRMSFGQFETNATQCDGGTAADACEQGTSALLN